LKFFFFTLERFFFSLTFKLHKKMAGLAVQQPAGLLGLEVSSTMT
jgi:hypothetical protein